MLKKMTEMGALASRLEVKIVGGAQMFNFNGGNDKLQIGPRNVEAIEKMLEKMNLKLVAKNTGGNHGRSVRFDLATRDRNGENVKFTGYYYLKKRDWKINVEIYKYIKLYENLITCAFNKSENYPGLFHPQAFRVLCACRI